MSRWYSYIRHSSTSEDQPNSLEAQRLLINTGVKLKQLHDEHLRSLEFGYECYDNDISGGMDFTKRPAGSILLTRVAKGDAIVSAKWDRMFRDSYDFERVREFCHKAGVRLICLDLDIDTFTANGALISRIVVAVATHKRDQQREDGRAAYNAVKHTKGVRMAHDEMYGWMRVRKSDHKNSLGHPYAVLMPDHKERAECEEILMRKEKLHWTWQQIADHFNKHGRIPARLKRDVLPSGKRFSKWTMQTVRRRAQAAKAGFPVGNYDLVDGQNREPLMIPVAKAE